MKQYPLEAIGQFFEMPNKEAWLNKVDPTLAFIPWFNNTLIVLGLVVITFIGIAFWLRARNRGR